MHAAICIMMIDNPSLPCMPMIMVHGTFNYLFDFSGCRDGFYRMITRSYKNVIDMSPKITRGHSSWIYRVISLQKRRGPMLCQNFLGRAQSIPVLPLIHLATSRSLPPRLVSLRLTRHGMWHGELARENPRHRHSRIELLSFVFQFSPI